MKFDGQEMSCDWAEINRVPAAMTKKLREMKPVRKEIGLFSKEMTTVDQEIAIVNKEMILTGQEIDFIG